MEMPDKLPDDFVTGIQRISIDASSIIYMLKTGILGYMAAETELVASADVIAEVGWPRLPVRAYPVDEEMSNDDTVIYIAGTLGIPVVSEDLEILTEAEERGFSRYNTLMMLNYLILKKRIRSADYDEYLHRLKEISRYSREVLEYGRAVRLLVEKSLL